MAIKPTKFKRTRFYFGRPAKAKVHMRYTHSNIFITITDLNNKVVGCHSLGSSGVLGSKKARKAPRSIEHIIRKLQPKFVMFKIRNVHVCILRRGKKVLHFLIRSLMQLGLRIVAFTIFKRVAHNGVRGRKLSRK